MVAVLTFSLRHEVLEFGLLWTFFLNMSYHSASSAIDLLPVVWVVVIFIGGCLRYMSPLPALSVFLPAIPC
jgi:hypothetical protein